MFELMNTGMADLLTAAGGWDLTTFLGNSEKQILRWVAAIVTIVGIIMVFVAIWKIASGLMSKGQQQVNWGLTLILLFVGGALSMTNGFEFMKDIAQGGQTTIKQLGGQGGAGVLMDYLKYYRP